MSTDAQTAALKKQADINEKLSYRSKAQEWKLLHVSGDTKTIAAMGGVSPMLISNAINRGTGSLRTLRLVNEYYEKRKEYV